MEYTISTVYSSWKQHINSTHVETRSATIEIERTIESLARGLNTMAKIASPEVAKTDRDTSTTFFYFFSGLMIKLGGYILLMSLSS